MDDRCIPYELESDGYVPFQGESQEEKGCFLFQALIMSNSRFAVLKINVAFNHRIGHTADWRSNCTAFMSDSLNNGEIGAANLPVSHLDGKDSGAERVFLQESMPLRCPGRDD